MWPETRVMKPEGAALNVLSFPLSHSPSPYLSLSFIPLSLSLFHSFLPFLLPISLRPGLCAAAVVAEEKA